MKTTQLLTYLLNRVNQNKNKKTEGHTSLLVYNKEEWLKFKHILSFESTNPNRVFWKVVNTVLEQFDLKDHSLDKLL